jgi:hypothetical protein
LLSDPKYRRVCDEAAFFIWAAQTDAYLPDSEFEDKVARVAVSKPLSGRVITSIWIEHLDEKQKKDRSALLGQMQAPDDPEVADPRAIAEGLEDMTDSQIDTQYKSVATAFARR